MTANAKPQTSFHRTPLVIWAVAMAVLITMAIAGTDVFTVAAEWVIYTMRAIWSAVVGVVSSVL